MLFSGIAKGADPLYFTPCAQRMDKLFNKKKPVCRYFYSGDVRHLQVDIGKEWKLNNSYHWHLCFSPSSPVLQSQKLETEQLFLHFCSIRMNEYGPNQSTTCMSYLISIPKALKFLAYQSNYTSRKIAEGADEVMGWCVEVLR